MPPATTALAALRSTPSPAYTAAETTSSSTSSPVPLGLARNWSAAQLARPNVSNPNESCAFSTNPPNSFTATGPKIGIVWSNVGPMLSLGVV